MATQRTMKQHDTWPPLNATLSDQDGVIDLTGAAQVDLLLKTATGGAVAGGECDIVSAVDGTVRYEWVPTDTADINTFRGEFQITWSDGTIQTIPNDGYFTITIIEDLGP